MELTHESNGKKYGVETKELNPGWNDSGFRHRVVCEDKRVSGWADYTRVAFLDDVASVTPYYHGTGHMVIVTVRDAMYLLAVGEVIETADGDVKVYPADDESVALQELSEIPTHIWFPGKKAKLAARVAFEMCWMQAAHADDETGTMSFCDYNGNGLTTVKQYGVPNELGSIVMQLGDRVLVDDPVNCFWGVSTTLQKAIEAMPNNMEDLPYTCNVYTGDESLHVTDTGVVLAGGKPATKLFSKVGKKITPNVA